MSDPASAPEPATAPSASSASASDAVNSQIRDAARDVFAMLDSQAGSFAQAAALQAMTHAIALGMHNAVAQQQHAQVLRSALTTAAARALLDGKREEADAVLKLAESKLINPDIVEELARLQTILRDTLGDLQKALASGLSVPSPATAAAA